MCQPVRHSVHNRHTLCCTVAHAAPPPPPQGGNTGLVGGSVPLHDEVVLSLSALDAIHSIDAASAVASVGSGVVLQALDAALAPHGTRARPRPAAGRGGEREWRRLSRAQV